MRLPRAYDICISHCLAVRSFNVSLSGRYSFIRLIRIIVLRNYIYFLLRAVPFQYGTCHTIRKLIEYKANVNRESAAVFIVGFVTQQIEKLSSGEGFIKRELFHRLKMRKCPELKFIADDSIAHSAEINKKLREI